MHKEDAIRQTTRTVGKTSLRSQPGYIFLCKGCGSEMWVTSPKVERALGKCRSCTSAATNRKADHRATYNKLRRIAKERHHDFSLTFPEFLKFTQENNCHYCGANIPWLLTKGNYNLDRKNNTKGYHKSNCVVCCKRCNYAKADRFTYEEWVLIGNLIRSFSGHSKEELPRLN